MQSIVCANGTRLAYVELGSPTAEPVVFLHGFTGTAHSHFGAELALLAPHMHVYGLDLRGYGASAPPYRVFGADFYERDARDVISFIETLGIGPVHLVGFSDGSEAAVMIAALAPHLVRSVIAWGICGQIAPEMVERVRRWLPISAWGPDKDVWKAEIIATQGANQLEPLITGWIDAAERISARGGDILHTIAHQVTAPVLIVHGTLDVGNPIPVVQALCARIPNARFVLLDDVGHSVQDDAPAALHNLMREFYGLA
jgi:valacyclovir hydrolase